MAAFARKLSNLLLRNLLPTLHFPRLPEMEFLSVSFCHNQHRGHIVGFSQFSVIHLDDRLACADAVALFMAQQAKARSVRLYRIDSNMN